MSVHAYVRFQARGFGPFDICKVMLPPHPIVKLFNAVQRVKDCQRAEISAVWKLDETRLVGMLSEFFSG